MTSSLSKVSKLSELKASLASHKKPLILKRTWIKVFTCSACFVMFLLRYNISVAIVAITDEVEPGAVPHGLIDGLGNFANESFSVQATRKKYPFDQSMVAQILASYFYGYTIFQLPAGRLGELFGAKHVLGLGTLLSGVVSLFAPLLLDWSPYALMVGRFFIGIFHASVLSCGYTFISQWMPSDQRTNSITLLNVSFESGGIAAFFLSGLLCSADGPGWRFSFYIFAILAILWFLPYYFLVYSTPDEDPHLSDYEKTMIEIDRMAEYANQDLSKKNMIKIPPKFDWKIILTSKPVIASCVGKSAIGLLYYMVTTKMPAYFHDVFGAPMKSNGAFTAMAVAGSLASKTLCLRLSNHVVNWRSMSLTTIRKIFQSIALLVPSLALIIITLKNDNQALDTCLIILSMFGMGFVCLGDTPITADFAKDLSGSLFGFTNTWACLMGVASPLIVSAFMSNARTVDERVLAWNYTFYVTIAFNIIGAVTFILFASAEPQPWAESRFVSSDEYAKEERRSGQSSA